MCAPIGRWYAARSVEFRKWFATQRVDSGSLADTSGMAARVNSPIPGAMYRSSTWLANRTFIGVNRTVIGAFLVLCLGEGSSNLAVPVVIVAVAGD